MPAPVELAPDYYLSNFRALLDFVMSRYRGLLSGSERQFYSDFCARSTHAQQLYVRLLSRKGVVSSAGALFRQQKLAYAEIPNLSDAVDELVTEGLLLKNPALDAAEILPLFTKAELLAKSTFDLPRSLKKPQLEQALLERVGASELAAILTRGESLLAVQAAHHFETFKLCFFGNLHQDLTDWVLRDLGLSRFESYPLDQRNLPFQSREQLEQHLRYYQCLALADEAMDRGSDAILAVAAQLPEGISGDMTLARRLDRLRLTLARQLERFDALDAADHLYQRCARPPARERRARIAIKRGEIARGLALCREILNSPLSEAEQVFAQSFGYRSAKSAGQLDDWKAPERYRAPSISIALPRDGAASANESVEQRAAQWLQATEPGNCFYVENTLFNSVLGLYVWDLVFAPLPGAFHNPFQSAPSDFRTAEFYTRRREAFATRLDTLDQHSLASRAWQNFEDKHGLANTLVAWEVLSPALLEQALTAIPAEHWRAIFQRLLSDIGNHRSGLPDLIHFPTQGSYELVEVKGPGDRVQQNQQRWMAYFARHGIPHRVMHVEWQMP